MSWTDVGVKVLVSRGARCEVCLLRGVGLRDGLIVPVAGVVVASMEWCPTRHVVGATSPCPVVGGFL